MNNSDTLHITLSRFQLLAFAFIALLVAIIANASIMEDPYITYRVVENFVRDGILSWSLDERVQPSTSPLWMLVHIPFYLFGGNIYFVSLLLSLACAMVAIWLPVYTFKRSAFAIICLFFVPLTLSAAFVKYSTSGFENSLQHALFAWFGWIIFRAQPRYFWFLITLCVSLSLFNRLDAMLFYAPMGAYLLCSRFRSIRWLQVLAGAAPLLLWELFSLFYYGFLFANSKYAKLNTGISDWEYARLGVSYIYNLFVVDFISALALLCTIAAIAFLSLSLRRGQPQENKDRMAMLLAIALGIVLYSLYVVVVGGTYLGGRMLSLPVYASFWLILALAIHSWRKAALALVAALLVAVRLAWPDPAVMLSRCPYCFLGINLPKDEEKMPLSDIMSGALKLLPPRSQSWYETPVIAGSIGRWGFMMKPDIKIVDFIAITDPLLARLPSNITHLDTMGNLPRVVPEGYIHYLKTGDMSQMDPDLAIYYGKLRFIISGDVWSMERIKEIIRFNLGEYDAARDRYVAKTLKH